MGVIEDTDRLLAMSDEDLGQEIMTVLSSWGDVVVGRLMREALSTSSPDQLKQARDAGVLALLRAQKPAVRA